MIVGLNEYTVEEDWIPLEILRIKPEVEKKQLARLQKLREQRDSKKVKEALDRVRQTAEHDENLMPPIIQAAKAYATLGEICNVLREVFGEYRELIVI